MRYRLCKFELIQIQIVHFPQDGNFLVNLNNVISIEQLCLIMPQHFTNIIRAHHEI